MTDTEQIADIVVAAVRASTVPMVSDVAALATRLSVIEAKHEAMTAAVSGCHADMRDCMDQIQALGAKIDAMPMPADGKDGTNGLDGRDGKDGSDAAVGPLADAIALIVERAHAIETRLDGVESSHLSDADLATQCEDLTRKAFGELPAPVPARRMQKRVIRDGDGRIERVVEEPVGP